MGRDVGARPQINRLLLVASSIRHINHGSRDVLTLQWGLLTFAIRQLDCLSQARTSNQTGAGLNDSASINHAELRSPVDAVTPSLTPQMRHQGAATMCLVTRHLSMLSTPARELGECRGELMSVDDLEGIA